MTFKLTIILGSLCHCWRAGDPIANAGECQHLELVEDEFPQAREQHWLGVVPPHCLALGFRVQILCFVKDLQDKCRWRKEIVAWGLKRGRFLLVTQYKMRLYSPITPSKASTLPVSSPADLRIITISSSWIIYNNTKSYPSNALKIKWIWNSSCIPCSPGWDHSAQTQELLPRSAGSGLSSRLQQRHSQEEQRELEPHSITKEQR